MTHVVKGNTSDNINILTLHPLGCLTLNNFWNNLSIHFWRDVIRAHKSCSRSKLIQNGTSICNRNKRAETQQKICYLLFCAKQNLTFP